MDDTEPDWMFDAEVTNDGKTVLIGVRKDCNAINLLYTVDLTIDKNKDINGLFEPVKVINDWIGEFSYLQNHANHFYFKTNYKAPKSKVIKIDLDSPD